MYLTHDRTALMLSNKIEEIWIDLKNDTEKFKWMMNWKPFKAIFKHYGKFKSLKRFVSNI